jgi:hypothetical protein
MHDVPGFAQIEECQIVINAYERCRTAYSRRNAHKFWNNRVLWINSFPDSENATRRILQAWRRRAATMLSANANCQLYSDTIQVVSWNGEEMPPHQDDRHPDGSPHGTPWREWASIIYLNSDFEGGEIYFPDRSGLQYKPVQGSIVFFKGAEWHGVRAVTGGTRYTAPGWFTRDPSREDQFARIDY